jgi:hypothetical protein
VTSSGGAIESAFYNSYMALHRVEFVNNSAQMDGGAMFLGEYHASVLLSEATMSDGAADVGGGLVVSRFCKGIVISSSRIVRNSANVAGGVASSADGLAVLGSIIEDNTAATSHGGLLVESAEKYLVVSECSVSRNRAGGSSGGLGISASTNVTIESCEFLDNAAAGGSGGGLSISESREVVVRNVSIWRNSAAGAGGGARVDSQSSGVTFLDTSWWENGAGERGGAIFVADSTAVNVSDSVFRDNAVQAGSGSAVYAHGSALSVLSSEFRGNSARGGGGTVFWEHASGMQEPAGLRTGSNMFDDSNRAVYGAAWATEAHHLRLAGDQEVFRVEEYDAFAPAVGMALEDAYGQVVLTDSSSLVFVFVPASQAASCNGEPGFVSGTVTSFFANGSTTFSALEPLCAPNHSLKMSVTTTLATVSGDASFEFEFRSCARGEYYGERICSPCEAGTFSFTDPHGVELSQLTKSSVCRACPRQALSCSGDTMVLRRGHWRSDNDSTNILECPWDAESCEGGAITGDASCGDGYRGPLCAICQDQHHFVSASQTCEPCDDTASFFDPYTLTLLALALACVLVVAYAAKRAIRGEEVATMDGFVAVLLLRLGVYSAQEYAEDKAAGFRQTRASRQRAAKSCVVYITFYQIVSTLPFILAEVDFPDVFDELMSAVSVVNLAINQESIVTCSTAAEYDFVARLVVATTVPVAVVLVLWVCCQAHMRCVYGGDVMSEERALQKRKTASNYKKAVLVFSFLILPSGMCEGGVDVVRGA